MAIVLLEFLGERVGRMPVQIFATDVSEAAVEHARGRGYRVLVHAAVRSETPLSFTGLRDLVGDVFDFWFEYNKAVPKGYVRILGKLAELHDRGIPITYFTGNHDMWLGDYFTKHHLPAHHIKVRPTYLYTGRGYSLIHTHTTS